MKFKHASNKPVYFCGSAWPNTRNIFNTTFCNKVGHNMLHTFGHPAAMCWNMLDDVESNLKTVKFFVQHFGCMMLYSFGYVHATLHSRPQSHSSLGLKCRWRVALDAPKNSNFFIGWQKMNAQQKWKLKTLYAVHFTSGPVRLEVDGGPFLDCSEFAGALYEKNAKQMVTIPDRSEGIVKVST